jgi:muconolactone delta-isomerase
MEMVEATAHYIDELKNSGKISEGCYFAASYGGIVVYDVEDLVEFHDLNEGFPARPLCSLEIVPLLTTDEFRKNWSKQKERALQMMAKMAPQS